MAATNLARSILSEIPDRAERPRLAATPTRMIATEPTPTNILNNAIGADPLGYLTPSIPSPDELIIRQRGRRRRVKLNWSPDKCPAPSRCPFQKTPTKTSSAMTLRSSPRRRLLDGLHFQTTPEKANKSSPIKISSAPTLRSKTLTTPLLKRLILDDTGTTPRLKRTRLDDLAEKTRVGLDPNFKIKGRLNLLSQKQLMNMVLAMIKEDPQVEKLVRKVTPRPDLSDFYDELNKIFRHIHRCSPKPTIRCSTQPTSSVRASSHIKEFKEMLQSHCTRLYKASEWDLLLDYHQMAWPIVRSLPVSDNSKHENARMQCFKFLCSMASIGLKNCAEKIGVTKIEGFEKILQAEAADSQDIQPVIDEVRNILGRLV